MHFLKRLQKLPCHSKFSQSRQACKGQQEAEVHGPLANGGGALSQKRGVASPPQCY